MNRTMTEINVNDHNEQEDNGLIAAVIIFSGSLLITLAALVSVFVTLSGSPPPVIYVNMRYRGIIYK